MVLPSIHAVNTSNWTHGIHDRFRLALSLLPFVSSDVYRTKGGHFWIKATRGRRRSYVEQHARLQLHLSPPDVLAGLCWCEVRQQTGFHLPGLCHRFHRLHLHRSARLCLQTSSFPVSQEFFVFGKSALAVDLLFVFFLNDQWAFQFAACAYWEIGPSVAMYWMTACVWRRSTCRSKDPKKEQTPTSPSSWVKKICLPPTSLWLDYIR